MIALAKSVWCDYIEILESTEGMQDPGEGLDGKLWFTAIYLSSWYSSSYSSPTQAATHMFLEQLAHSLGEPGWEKQTLSSDHWGSVF